MQAGQLGVRVTHGVEAIQVEDADTFRGGDAETTAHLGQAFLFHRVLGFMGSPIVP